MLTTAASRPPSSNRFKLTNVLTPLALGITVLTSMGMPAEARPVVIRSQPPSSHIYGSPIPAPILVNPTNGRPHSASPYDYRDRDYDDYRDYGDYRDYDDYRNHRLDRRGVRGGVRNSTLINPTIIDSTITDSVLVDPVIINGRGHSRVPLRRSRSIHNSPGITIQLGL